MPGRRSESKAKDEGTPEKVYYNLTITIVGLCSVTFAASYAIWKGDRIAERWSQEKANEMQARQNARSPKNGGG
ncbi:hypothetical protein TR75_06435 [Hydrogenibacillus schlegelii]|uniref:Uncharacterized protein n=1 Tax=Hydrogenibacillus schlegelii TaxID=1484 RepID=A0A132N863_HYDSH|nr:hypothetical protein TR75_06435 [Hydrogenibacillus schlegelii]OAR03357.1 hypothetical protein SA87_04195 [Hydrogenibacillus schlegelii]